jgi:hypothetical protein
MGLLGAPVAAPALAWLVCKLPPGLQRRAYATLGCIPLLVAALVIADLSTASYQTNASAVVIAYWASMALALSAFRLRVRALRYALGATAIFLLLLSVLMGTFGGLATVFIVGETIPVYTGSLDETHTCNVTSYGNATTQSGGYRVTVAVKQPFAPFLERTITSRQYESPQQDPADLCQATFIHNGP